MRRTPLLALALIAGACTAESGLTVDVRTDFRPSADFVAVRTEVAAHPFASPAPEGTITERPAGTSDYGRGVRVDERPGLAAGDWYVRVTLVAASGAAIAQRTVAVHLVDRHALTVVLARSCTGVTCPTAADPALTECSGGTCVSPSCSPETPLACPAPACRTDAECAASSPCVRPTCAAGVCLAVEDDALCPDAGAGDAGVRSDAGVPSFVLHRLPRGGTAWTIETTTGLVPTEPIEAAFAMRGTDEMMVLTHSELYVLRPSTLEFLERRARDPIFPELAGTAIATAVGIYPYIHVTAHDTWIYAWDPATRTAALHQYIPHEDLGADWQGPLAPPWYREYAAFYVPDNGEGYAHYDTAALVCGPTSVANYDAFLTRDASDPPTMITTIWNGACSQFVDRSVYGSSEFGAFALPGAPADPFSILAVEYAQGLWVFTSP